MQGAVYARILTGFDSQNTTIPKQIKLFEELTVGTEVEFFNWLKVKVMPM